jgi:LysM repeat protein
MKNLKRSLVVLSLLSVNFSFAETDYKALKLSYIEQYRTTAIQQMIHTKIPASITLAQGLLESGAGTSRLATLGNNHFGIKCHEWRGDRMYHDDDAKGECFRVYGNAELSFLDHSEFLMNRDRYAFLFGLTTTDYEGWAKGLKKAGYATNPQYANILIKLIEDYDLDDFDAAILPPNKSKGFFKDVKSKFSISENTDSKNTKNAFVVAEKGDTYYRISREFSTAMWELRKYNDYAENKEVLEEGDKVFLEPKKNNVNNSGTIVVAQQNQTLRIISQDLGIKLKRLQKCNPELQADQILKKGTKINVD